MSHSFRSTLALAVLPGLFLLVTGCTPDSNASSSRAASLKVKVEAVEVVSPSQRLHYSGTIQEADTYPASFAVSGIAQDVFVEEGQEVRRGQKLATLDDATARNSYDMAEATYNRARDAVERLTPMHENGTLPEIQFVEAQTGLAQARAAFEIAKRNLEDCVLKADSHGLVGKRSINPGEGAAPGMAAITIVDIDKVEAVIAVHENEISSIKRGMEAAIIVPALGNRSWDGEVVEVGVVADPLSHTYKVKVLVDNSDHAMRPGMVCNTVILPPSDQQTMIVPIQAVLVDSDGRTYVYTVDATTNTTRRQVVQRKGYLHEGIEITDGLQPGDLVVVAGQHRLYDNAAVSFVRETGLEVGEQ